MLNVRIKILFIFSLLLFYFLVNTSYTDADLFAERSINNNQFSSTTLDFALLSSANSSSISTIFNTQGLQPGGFDVGAARIKKIGTMNPKYSVTVRKVNGDDTLCNALTVSVLQRNLEQKYKGKLMDLSLNASLTTTTPEDWIFFLDLEGKDAQLKNKICEFTIQYKSYRVSPDEKGGLFAERSVKNIISTSNW